MIELLEKKKVMTLLEAYPELKEKADQLTVYALDEITEEILAAAQSESYDVAAALKEIDRIFTHEGKNIFERTKGHDLKNNAGNRKAMADIAIPGRK